MNHREFKQREAEHVAHAHNLIERVHRQAAAARIAREAYALQRRCEEAGEGEAAEWLGSARAAVQGAQKELAK